MRWLRHKSHGPADEVVRYGAVIFISFFIDWITLVILTGVFDISRTPSFVVAYIMGMLVNYYLSIRWVFVTRRFTWGYELFFFVSISVLSMLAGLGIFSALTAIGVGVGLGKVLTELAVGFVSLLIKKIFLFSRLAETMSVMRQFSPLGYLDRIHVWVRWISVPYARIRKHIPAGKTLLEYGCGHAIFSGQISTENTFDSIVAYDIDTEKIRGVRRTHPTITAVDNFKALQGKKFDVIIVSDVVYLYSKEELANTLTSLEKLLAKGGTLVIKEMSARPHIKLLYAKLQEYISIYLLRITSHDKSVRIYETTVETVKEALESRGYSCRIHRVDSGYPHPHALVLASKGKS